MTYADAIRFLYNLRWFGAKLGLDNTFKLAALAGNPQNQLRFIHVAGTNGKGSTCAMLESIYRAAGLRVGLFTSPHLVAFGERIQVNRKLISEENVARLVAEMRSLLEQGWGAHDVAAGILPAVESCTLPPGSAPPTTGTPIPPGKMPGSTAGRMPAATAQAEHPTFFEVVTVMALRYFAEQGCDLVVWETGLGGRLDATNIVTPLAGIITNIQYDHQKWLGETLASIAAEKAGIIKPGISLITGTEAPEALQVIEQTARDRHAPLVIVPPSDTRRPPLEAIQLPLLGQHQRMNAAVALAAVRVLAPLIPVSEDNIRAGLARVHWPGRLQTVTRTSGQRILLDGAHNVSGAEILAAASRQYFPGVRPALVLGILRDKDWPAMCEILAPLAGRILLVPVHSERTAEPHGLAEVCGRANPAAQVSEYPSLAAALGDTDRESFVTIAGSLYLIGEAMELLRLSPIKANNERGLNEWGGVLTASEPRPSAS
jgi:dihydrofolate synthase / folylpolyglutamate synthase